MKTETNPYQPPSDGPPIVGSSAISPKQKISRAFRYSYFTSLAVALTVVAIWLTIVLRSIPPGQGNGLWPPGVLQVLLLLLSMAPSVVTCSLFSIVYGRIFRTGDDVKLWHMLFAMLFGALSGLAFNAMTAIWTIEYLFTW